MAHVIEQPFELTGVLRIKTNNSTTADEAVEQMDAYIEEHPQEIQDTLKEMIKVKNVNLNLPHAVYDESRCVFAVYHDMCDIEVG